VEDQQAYQQAAQQGYTYGEQSGQKLAQENDIPGNRIGHEQLQGAALALPGDGVVGEQQGHQAGDQADDEGPVEFGEGGQHRIGLRGRVQVIDQVPRHVPGIAEFVAAPAVPSVGAPFDAAGNVLIPAGHAEEEAAGTPVQVSRTALGQVPQPDAAALLQLLVRRAQIRVVPTDRGGPLIAGKDQTVGGQQQQQDRQQGETQADQMVEAFAAHYGPEHGSLQAIK